MPTDSTLFDSGQSIQQFLAATAGRQPTPGGGSVTALVGALAAAIGEMSLNYSVGKNTPPERLPRLQQAITAMQQHRDSLLALMVQDQSAYATLTAVHRLPADAPDRASQLHTAVVAAVAVPEFIAGTALQVLEQCEAVVDWINPRLLSDLAVSADLAMATVRCAIYNARVNLPELTDITAREARTAEINRMLSNAAVLIQRISPQIWNRHAQFQKSQQ